MPSHVFLSGTNSGIGRLTALTLAQRGHRVFATMRDPSGAHQAAAAELVNAATELPGHISVYAMELATEESVNEACARILADAGHIDVLVNNAGLTCMGLAETITDQQLLYQLDVNLVGPHRVLRAMLPSMRARGRGLLVHVSDTMGRVVWPTFGVHCAAKAGLEALMDAYRLELAPLGIESTIIEPGLFPTGFVQRLEVGEDHERMATYGPNKDALDRMGGVVRQRLASKTTGSPQMVADTIAMLIELSPGSRPDRFVVDAHDGGDLLRLNDAHRRAQTDVLAKIGFGPPPREPDPTAT